MSSLPSTLDVGPPRPPRTRRRAPATSAEQRGPLSGQTADRVLRAIAAVTSTAIVVTDPDRVVEWANPGFTRQTGYPLEEVLGLRLEKLVQTLAAEAGAALAISETLDRGEPFAVTVENTAKDGRRYWVDIDIEPILDAHGHVTAYLLMQDDVSERRDHEETMRRANAAMQDLNTQFEHAIERAQQLAMEAAVANQAKSAFL
ncbi:MAG TPA: PAS domain-containing protein, partial [Opitutus sp.]|nr:PAS domain-containing protein [Opitutus sp.]